MFPEWEFKSKVCKSPSRSVIAGYMCLYLIKSIHYEPSFYLDHTNLVTTRIYSLHQPVTSSLRGVSAPAGTLCVTPTAGFTSVPISFFSLHQVPVCWSKAARFTTNPLCEHSYCKPIVCQVGSDTHTSRLHNHALFHCHNTLDWFIIVQLPLQKHFHIHPYVRIDCYSPLTDKLLLHALSLFNAVLW